MRTDQYQLTVEYDKTFLTGNLTGMTVHIKYGTCTVREPYSIKNGMVLIDCITGNESVVSNYNCYPNY